MTLRTRLISIFLAATLIPLGVTLWIVQSLLDKSLSYASTKQLDEISESLKSMGRAHYEQSREILKRDAVAGRSTPARFLARDQGKWADDVSEFMDSGEDERFVRVGPQGNELRYMLRRGGEADVYSMTLNGPSMTRVSEEYTRARDLIDHSASYDLRKGFTYTFVLLAAIVWLVSLTVLIYLADRTTRPIQELTAGLAQLAGGNLAVRLDARGNQEVSNAMRAFNDSAQQLQQSRDRLVYLTRLASWQTLARKMAHEVKNSLTPIRLTMEELIARGGDNDQKFIDQAAQIVVDEVITLERRVRAFSEFAAEPPVRLETVDMNSAVEERVSLLKNAHPEIAYDIQACNDPVQTIADPDLVKGVLTNLLENAADAAGTGGTVRVKTFLADGKVGVEIHDSGPGLSAQARGSLFEPTISFKKRGMGLGLSIARRSTLLSGGDLELIDGELGGAAFRLLLPAAGAPGTPVAGHTAEPWTGQPDARQIALRTQ